MGRINSSLTPLAFGDRSKAKTSSLRDMQDAVARSMGWSADYDAIGDRRGFSTEQFSIQINKMRLTTIAHTPIRTRVNSGEVSFFMPFAGGPIQSVVNDASILCEVSKTALFAPEGERVGVGGYRSTFIASLERDRLLRVARAMTGQPDLNLDLNAPQVMALKVGQVDFDLVLRSLFQAIDACGADGQSVARLGLDDVLYRAICAMLLPQQTIIDESQRQSRLVETDKRIDVACDFIRENLSGRITITELEEISGLSARSLQYAFQRRFNCSPITWIRNERLNYARAILTTSDHGSVTQAALAVGFSNIGTFAKYYFEKFGEYPSQALIRSRSKKL